MKRSKFEQVIDEQLETIDLNGGKVARINQIREQISQLEKQISDLKVEMQREKEGLVGNLAISIRKSVPGLSVNLSNGKCNINHLSNMLSLWPNLDNNAWDIEPNVSGRRFRKYHGHCLGLRDDVNTLSNGISQFFRTRYKRLSGEGMPAVGPSLDKEGHATRFG